MANKRRGYYTIKLGGKNRTLHFSMNFWANFTDALGVSLEELADIFSQGVGLKDIRSIIYCAILANDQEQGNEIDYNEFKVGLWMDDLDGEKLSEIVNAMMETRLLGNDLNAGVARNVKKSTKGK